MSIFRMRYSAGKQAELIKAPCLLFRLYAIGLNLSFVWTICIEWIFGETIFL